MNSFVRSFPAFFLPVEESDGDLDELEREFFGPSDSQEILIILPKYALKPGEVSTICFSKFPDVSFFISIE